MQGKAFPPQEIYSFLHLYPYEQNSKTGLNGLNLNNNHILHSKRQFYQLSPRLYPTSSQLLQIKLLAYFFLQQQLQKSPEEMQKTGKRQRNARISLKRRQNLIELIEKENFTLCRAARKLNIKFSTARLILKKYEETGTFFNKNMRRVRRSKEDLVKVEDEEEYEQSSMEDDELNETEEKGKGQVEAVGVKSQENLFPFVNNYYYLWNSLPFYYVTHPEQVPQSSI